ncbi:uncharacterized protein LOC135836633 [Planococcus citri]|uniref:uncharacterized protein LOC135836633 n=1 Tax=Planococcus citri TaxID=170843 RepID=UPI0031F9C5FB
MYDWNLDNKSKMAINTLKCVLFLLPLMKADEMAEYNIVDFNQLPTIHLEQFYSDVFSEMNIFYEPNTNSAVPLISKSAGNIEKNFFRRIYGNLPCVCTWGGCDCCVDIKIRILNVLQNGCVKLRALSNDNTGIQTELQLNQQSIIRRRISFDQTPPLCIPFPPFPAISICIRLTDIMRDGGNIKACVHFDLRITGTLAPLWTLQFTCVRFGFSGISWFQPETPTPPQSLPQPNGFLLTPPVFNYLVFF